jgi:serine/threonine protein kinase
MRSPPQHLQITDYRIGSVIGKGGFGKIREIQRKKDSQWFALKIFEFENLSLSSAELILNEVTALSSLPLHPFILQLYATYRDSSSLSFVLDLFSGGDLRLFLQSDGQQLLTENKIAYVIACLGSALHHLHLHRILHRDLKPENIMFDSDGIPKLIDFGIAYLSPPRSGRSFDDEPEPCVCNHRSGTSQYIAPENFVYQNHFHSYESDFWSLGIVMYEMLFHHRPYEIRVPSAFVKYSHLTYQATWRAYLKCGGDRGGGSVAGTPKSLNGTPKCVMRTTSINSLLTENSPSSILSLNGGVGRGGHTTSSVAYSSTPSSPSVPLPSTMTEFFLLQENNDSSSPLSSDLIVPMPPFTSLSSSCLSLLSSLLDVRLHKRLGVGAVNYSLFENHIWFKSHGVEVKNVSRQRSPISPDLDEISTLLWQRHFETNLKDSERAMAAMGEVLAPNSGDENEDSTFDSAACSSLLSPLLSEEVRECLEQIPLILSSSSSKTGGPGRYHEAKGAALQQIISRQRG